MGDSGLTAGSVSHGVLLGGTSGSGVILLSLLMAGREGAAVIATEAESRHVDAPRLACDGPRMCCR